MKPKLSRNEELENINYKLIQENIILRKRLYELLKYIETKQDSEEWSSTDFNNCLSILRGGK